MPGEASSGTDSETAAPFSPRELAEARAGLPVWGRHFAEVGGPLGALFDKAAQTLVWRGVEAAVNHVLPGAGVLVRIIYYISKYQAVLAAVDEGRGADVQVGVGGIGDLRLDFTIRLGAEDEGSGPRMGVLVELNFVDPLGLGGVDAEAPGRVALVVAEGRGPWSSLVDLFGIEAVRDHATVLGLAASLTVPEVKALIRALRRRSVRVRVSWNPRIGEGTVTVDDGYGTRTAPLPLA
jgi:hypothetical protein